MKTLARLMLALILIGIGITSYLAYVHYSGAEILCPIEPQLNCNAVLSSGYATFVGVPVAVLGFLVYTALLIALILHEKYGHQKTDKILLLLPSVGVLAAGFYTGVMLFRLHALCLWCEASHVTMLVLFVLSARHLHPHWSWTNIFRWWTNLLIIGFLLSFVFTTDLTPVIYASKIADCLTQKNVHMYGAYWCPHCKEQKRLFGDAFSKINYIECADPSSPKTQLPVCKDAKIIGYPTWDLNGKRISGTQPLDELAKFADCSLK